MIIYKITNLINGKIYIGQSYKNNTRYLGGGKNIRLAHKKYGKKNFKKEIIIEGNFNQDLTNDLEIHYIQLYNSTNDIIGYNIMKGGKFVYYSKERNEKISKALTGKKRDQIFKDKCRLRQIGIKRNTKTRKSMSASRLLLNTGKPVIQMNLNNDFINRWTSGGRAAKELNYTQGCISKACKLHLKYKNFYWKFEEIELTTK